MQISMSQIITFNYRINKSYTRVKKYTQLAIEMINEQEVKKINI